MIRNERKELKSHVAAKEVKEIREIHQLPDAIVLPHKKGNYRKGKRYYRDILSQQYNDKITVLFADEIALFGYEY